MSDSDVESLRAEVANLREELTTLRGELANEVRTKRVVVERDGGDVIVLEWLEKLGSRIVVFTRPEAGQDSEFIMISADPQTELEPAAKLMITAEIGEEHFADVCFSITEGLTTYEAHPGGWKPVKT